MARFVTSARSVRLRGLNGGNVPPIRLFRPLSVAVLPMSVWRGAETCSVHVRNSVAIQSRLDLSAYQ